MTRARSGFAKPLPTERDAEQHGRRTERVGDRKGDRPEAEVHARATAPRRTRGSGRRRGGTRTRARSRAGSRRRGLRLGGGRRRKRALDEQAELREEQRRRDRGTAGRSRRCAADPGAVRACRGCTTAKRIETTNVVSRPAMIANGRRRPPLAPPARTMGRTGSTHGEIAVITPARNAIPSRTSI